MDIAEFYDADPRRREADEHTFGTDWRLEADDDHRWDLFWNAGTGELFLMAKPVHSSLVGWNIEDLKDDIRALEALGHRIISEIQHLVHPRQVQAKTGRNPGERYKEALEEELTVEVLSVIPTLDEVTRKLAGWQGAVGQPDSLSWVRQRTT